MFIRGHHFCRVGWLPTSPGGGGSHPLCVYVFVFKFLDPSEKREIEKSICRAEKSKVKHQGWKADRAFKSHVGFDLYPENVKRQSRQIDDRRGFLDAERTGYHGAPSDLSERSRYVGEHHLRKSQERCSSHAVQKA